MRERRVRVWLAAMLLAPTVALSAWALGPASAQQVLGVNIRHYFQIVYRFCLGDIVIVWEKVPPIVVGCEVIDCCPGCPGPGLIDWRIRFAGGAIDTLTLRFDNLSPEASGRLKVTGAARWRENGVLQLARGEATVSGFAFDRSLRPPLARIGIEPAALKRAQAVAPTGKSADVAAGDEAAQPDLPPLELLIEQRLGGVVVNEYVVVFRPRWCGPLRFPRDEIRLTNNDASDNAVVLLDARRTAGCRSDEIWRGNGTINVGSVLSRQTCNSEAAILSDDDAVLFLDSVNVWTDPLGDRLPGNLTPNLLQAPVTIWILLGPFATTQTRALTDVARADVLYNTMHCGSAFVDTIVNATADPQAAGLLASACGNANNLRTQIGFTANRMNVYYVNTAGGARGWWCGGNTVIIAAIADNESLAHEFGHAFTLDHTNNLDLDGDGTGDFPATNVMITGGTGRNSITEGQCLRCNLEPTSMLNVNGVRTGVTRACGTTGNNSLCTIMSLDEP